MSVKNFIVIGLLVLAVTGITGCNGQGGGSLPGVPDGASTAIQEMRDLLLESSMMNVPLANENDTVNFEGRFPSAVAAIRDKSITVVWKQTVRDGVSPDTAKIIAHESKAATDGGWVVKDNGEIYQVSAAEFSSQLQSPK